jgi:hypothetical protein
MSARSVSGPQTPADVNADLCAAGQLTLKLDEFARNALLEESSRLGVSREELAEFSLLYYLADVDSGRISRRVPRTPLKAIEALPTS